MVHGARCATSPTLSERCSPYLSTACFHETQAKSKQDPQGREIHGNSQDGVWNTYFLPYARICDQRTLEYGIGDKFFLMPPGLFLISVS